jgi:hypothetical protein
VGESTPGASQEEADCFFSPRPVVEVADNLGIDVMIICAGGALGAVRSLTRRRFKW